MTNEKEKGIFYLSNDRAMYLGNPQSRFKRDYVSSTLLLSFGDAMEVYDQASGTTRRSNSLLIPADSSLSVNTFDSAIAFYKLDDFGADFDKLKASASGLVENSGRGIYTDIHQDAQFIRDMEAIWSKRASASDAFDAFYSWVDFHKAPSSTGIDKRVVNVISSIKDTRDENVSVNDLAKYVNLSVTQLSYLFKMTTGTSIRRYRVWQRILFSAVKLCKGMSLQDTAMDMGFSDYAHFSRAYKKLAGGKLSNFKNMTEIKVLES